MATETETTFVGTIDEIREKVSELVTDDRISVRVDKPYNYGSTWTVYLTTYYDGYKRKTLRKTLEFVGSYAGTNRTYSIDLSDVTSRVERLVKVADDEEARIAARSNKWDREKRVSDELGLGYGSPLSEELYFRFGYGTKVSLNSAYESGRISVKFTTDVEGESVEEVKKKLRNLIDAL